MAVRKKMDSALAVSRSEYEAGFRNIVDNWPMDCTWINPLPVEKFALSDRIGLSLLPDGTEGFVLSVKDGADSFEMHCREGHCSVVGAAPSSIRPAFMEASGEMERRGELFRELTGRLTDHQDYTEFLIGLEYGGLVRREPLSESSQTTVSGLREKSGMLVLPDESELRFPDWPEGNVTLYPSSKSEAFRALPPEVRVDTRLGRDVLGKVRDAVNGCPDVVKAVAFRKEDKPLRMRGPRL
jgi:hypothetical protein